MSSFLSTLSAVRLFVLMSMHIISEQKANDMRTHQSSMRAYDYRSPADKGGRGQTATFASRRFRF